MTMRRVRGSSLLVSAAALWLAACATASAPAPAPAPAAAPAQAPPRPAAYQSEDFVVTFAQPGDTPETLAERYLGDADKGWMIEDYTGLRAFAPGQEVVIPRRPWNPVGVTSGGYQIVPILTYHNLAEQAKGRLVLAAASFREQMRYLKTNGYRVVSLADFIEFSRLNRQLPQRAVVLTFDDGYRAFKDHAYPVLKELGFTATLFIYTDWVGAGRGRSRGRTCASWPPRASTSRPTARPTRTCAGPRARRRPSTRAACRRSSNSRRTSSIATSAAAARSWPIPTAAGRKACCPR